MKFLVPAFGMVLAVAGSLAGHISAFGHFLTTTCGVSDVAATFPADASLQGWACGVNADDAWYVPGVWTLAISAVLAVVLVVAFWSAGGSWRWLAPLPVVLCPVLALVLLALPPDTCTDEARQTHTAQQCRTTS